MATISVNRERLARVFTELCEISSPSREERGVCDYLQKRFTELEADFIHEDGSAARTGSDSGNLIVRFNGAVEAEPLFFACHMDTVNPGRGVRVVRTGDIFTSAGETVLGGDDKSGVAAVVELVTLLKEHRVPHRTMELIFTTCEEVGLLGAKSLELEPLQARIGYALDSNGMDKVIVGAPAANKMRIDVHGTAAHAGMNPEAGVSAFLVAAEAITRLRLGRIDDESTANLGIMEGGVATNIIPEQLMIRGEVRSHSPAKLASYTDEIRSVFETVAASWPAPGTAAQPSATLEVEFDYPVMKLSEEDPVIQTLYAAGRRLGRELTPVIAGGGSDANIYNSRGLATAILATGMDQVHTTDERLDLNDIVSLTELLQAIVAE